MFNKIKEKKKENTSNKCHISYCLIRRYFFLKLLYDMPAGKVEAKQLNI